MALKRLPLILGNLKLPRPSYVVLFWVVYIIPYPKTHSKPKKELHWSPGVDAKADLEAEQKLLKEERSKNETLTKAQPVTPDVLGPRFRV